MDFYCLLVMKLQNYSLPCDYVHELISDVLAFRIVVYSPQLYENYTLQSGEGLSVLFVVIWILGDLSNLAGAILAGLLPTVIILGLYVRALCISIPNSLNNLCKIVHVV